MESIIETYNPFLLNEIWLYSMTNQVYLITLLMVFSLVAYLFVKNRSRDSFTLTTSEQHHFLQAVTKYSDTADFILDKKGILKFANDHFLELFGLEKGVVDNQPLSDINVSPKLKELVQKENFNEDQNSEFTLNSQKYTCKKAPVTTHDGQHLGTLFKISDHVLTGINQSETGRWLHEINTPLNAIVGYAEILSNQEGLTPEQNEYLSTINAQSFQLKSKISQLLSEQGTSNVIDGRDNPDEIKNILIVDDVPINRTVLKIMLVRMGYHISEAVNGKEALEKFEREKIDLILMDISMPVMNGVEAARKLRKKGNTLENLPIVAVTASSFYKNRETLREKGFNALLKKPFKEKDLTNILDSVKVRLN